MSSHSDKLFLLCLVVFFISWVSKFYRCRANKWTMFTLCVSQPSPWNQCQSCQSFSFSVPKYFSDNDWFWQCDLLLWLHLWISTIIKWPLYKYHKILFFYFRYLLSFVSNTLKAYFKQYAAIDPQKINLFQHWKQGSEVFGVYMNHTSGGNSEYISWFGRHLFLKCITICSTWLVLEMITAWVTAGLTKAEI